MKKINGNTCKYLWWNDSKEESGVTCAGYFCDMPQHKVSRQGIQEWVVLYCAGGKGSVGCNHKPEIEAQEGMLFCLPAGVPHTYSAYPQQPWKLYWFHCTQILESENMKQLPFARKIYSGSAVTQCMESLLEELEKTPSPMRTVRCRAFAQLVLSSGTQTQNDTTAEKARRWIEQHCEQETTVEEIAAMFNLSEYHFIRMFRDYTGLPPRRYQLEMKSRKACALLEQTDDSIAQISENLGYASPYYFSRQFKQIIGCSPRDYRKKP